MNLSEMNFQTCNFIWIFFEEFFFSTLLSRMLGYLMDISVGRYLLTLKSGIRLIIFFDILIGYYK